MALTWAVDHDARLVMLDASGPLTRRDVAHYMAEVTAAGAADYRVLLDARAAQFELGAAEIADFGRRTQGGGDGPIALVVASDAEREMADHFARRAGRGRACRLFATPDSARAWLDGAA
ncbi:MAG: hypothetical protein KF889_18300 [Alphaproteobacteria bacterium]|nr:hypothetical protein [Alphaproteobacteria bacterium]MCW5743981.1 hypothetical protein [Alphaproteobacteria bacterium]